MPRLPKLAQKTSALEQPPTGKKPATPEHDRIAQRAYELWQQRGCPIGSPEEDWKRAQTELRSVAAS